MAFVCMYVCMYVHTYLHAHTRLQKENMKDFEQDVLVHLKRAKHISRYSIIITLFLLGQNILFRTKLTDK
jgi:hypothetical protein